MSGLHSSGHIIRILKSKGFTQKSQKGSHVKYIKGPYTVIIPHPKREIPMGTFLSILRQAHLDKNDFK